MTINSCENIQNNDNNGIKETLKGYVVDMACIRTHCQK